MLEIIDNRISNIGDKWIATCQNCKKQVGYLNKSSALTMLDRGTCRHCKVDYRSINCDVPIYKKDNKWGKNCSGCGNEQLYTRKDHAKQSYIGDWQCKPCVSKAKGYSNNLPVGNEKRLYNQFHKSAKNRKIEWNITLEEIYSKYNGKCSLTGWDIDISYLNCTASLDRIDSKGGYTKNNVQWVHTMVNMCKSKYNQGEFIDMCRNITEYQKTNIERK